MKRWARRIAGCIPLVFGCLPQIAAQEVFDPPTLEADSPAASLFADEETVDRVYGESFGGQHNYTMIGAADFRPLSSTTTWAYDGAGYLYRTGGGTTFWAPVHLPLGAQIDNLCYFYFDNAATAISFDFAVYELYFAGNPGFLLIHSGASVNPPIFYQSVCANIAPHVFRAQADFNGDGTEGFGSYRLVFDLAEANDTHRLGGVRLRWRRTISPDPATATYTDVPVGHPQHQYVEALKSAGITAGCAASPARFCPELPVTRGQLAVFLAKALGLHWPR